MTPIRVFLWHVHGGYQRYMTQRSQCEFYVPFKPDRSGDYIGLPGHDWPSNLHEIDASEVRELDLDCVIFQRPNQYLKEQFEIFSDVQLKLPKIYIEHDPPLEHPTNTKHIVDDPNMLLVHVTPYNALMWDSNRTQTRVIDHGVPETDVLYTGELNRGIVVINNIQKRGRRLGLDIYHEVREQIPLDLIGMGASEVEGGLHEVPYTHLPQFESRYRFFFNPIRYTSLGLAVCEAMMMGMPIMGLATTEMSTAIENGVSGFVDTRVDHLISHMERLLRDPQEAKRLGEGARHYAKKRFDLNRFAREWDDAIGSMVSTKISFSGTQSQWV
jgi:glycosyltransferase involved in cell wall biosynthesis